MNQNQQIALFIIIIVLAFGYLAFIVIETILIKKYRKSFKYVIHINGIRGKSTTTRLIDAGLRGCGFKVFTKTTGTIPCKINTENQDVKIKRLGHANIREQISMMKEAWKAQADVLVLECMAVNPELQRICEEQILHADICVITNVREDHIMDMGNNLDEIAEAFSNTIPRNGHLIINNGPYVDYFRSCALSKNTTCNVALEYNGDDDLQTFKENIAESLEVARVLNLDLDKYFEGMKHYHHDFGAYEQIKLNNTIFLNGLSINDPESIKIVYDEIIKTYDVNNITILLNNRFDRPNRVLQHIELIKNIKCKKVLIYGSNPNYVIKKVKETKPEINISLLKNVDDLKQEEIVFAIGNIGEKGMEILDYFRKNGEKIW